MSHKWLSTALAAALVCGGAAFAQDDKDKKDQKTPMEQTQETKRTTPAGTTKHKKETVVGEVKKYDPGKSIEVSAPGMLKKSRTFDLGDKDITANVDSSVAVGSKVRVVQSTDDNGHKTLTVEPYEHASSRGHEKEKDKNQ